MNSRSKIKSFILGPVLFTSIILLIYAAVYYFLLWNNKLLGNILFLFGFFKGGLFTFWFIGISYKWLWNLDTLKNRPYKAGIVVILIFLISTGFLKLMYENNQLYHHTIDHNRKGFEGYIHEKDSLLGYKQVKGAQGSITSKYREKIPLKIDENGFRVPTNRLIHQENDSLLILFLGCSNTFGNHCVAEETFSYIVSDSLKCRYINAGVCGYGLSQMYILAQRLIPKYKPNIVVAQYSDWLTQRTINGYAPTYLIDIPNPYFTEEEGEILVQPPPYTSNVWEMTIWKPDESKSNLSNYVEFSLGIGLPNLLRNYYLYAYYKVAKGRQRLKDARKMEYYVYNEFYHLAKENNSKLIILNLGHAVNGKITNESHELLKQKDILFAEADSLLLERASYSYEKYKKIFHHWGFDGKDSVRFDAHPNHLSHSIIARSILDAINKEEL